MPLYDFPDLQIVQDEYFLQHKYVPINFNNINISDNGQNILVLSSELDLKKYALAKVNKFRIYSILSMVFRFIQKCMTE